MAILFEQARSFPWFRIGLFALILITLFTLTYFLFFAPTPRIDVVLPPPLERIGDVSQIEFIDLVSVTSSDAFRRLRRYEQPIGVGNPGRENPFLPL